MVEPRPANPIGWDRRASAGLFADRRLCHTPRAGRARRAANVLEPDPIDVAFPRGAPRPLSVTCSVFGSRMSAQQIHHGCFELRRIVVPVAVHLPRLPGKGAVVGRRPGMNGIVCLPEPVVGPDVCGRRHFAGRRLHGLDLARGRELAHHLDTEVDVHGIATAFGMVIEENVVPVGPEAWLRAQEGPDLIERWPPGGADLADRDLTG